jgi:predicted enzyme related to lactoylglutathione lyase
VEIFRLIFGGSDASSNRGVRMNYKLDHIAFNCKDLSEAAKYYENHFGGKPTPIRKAGDGHGFCFINISGAAAIQLIESQSESGINHYGFVTDDVEQVARELKEKNAEIIREIRDAGGKLTTLFVKDCNGLKMEVRLPR